MYAILCLDFVSQYVLYQLRAGFMPVFHVSKSKEYEIDYEEAIYIPEDSDSDDNTGNADGATMTDYADGEDNTGEQAFDIEDDALCDEENLTEEAISIPDNPSPIIYSAEQLFDYDFLLSNCYVVDSSTSVNPDEINAKKLLDMDMSIDLNTDDVKILIYHTHGSETFSDSKEGVIEDTVIGVGDELARILEEDYNIAVYHDRNVYDVVNGVLDRSYAYTLSGAAVDEILKQYPSIEVVLDIHRDGVREDLRLVRNIDGRPTAQIMFLNGVSRLNVNGDIEYLYNPHKIENLSFSLKLHLMGKSLYGDLIRKIYVRGYCFNLDRAARASLIEVGAQTNTVEEAKNAMLPLAQILYNVLSGQ